MFLFGLVRSYRHCTTLPLRSKINTIIARTKRIFVKARIGDHIAGVIPYR